MVTTIRDVARACGVSIATVSRALAGSTIVAAGTRERVRQAAAELGYQPNRAARQLVTGRGQSIALVLPDLQNSFYSSVAKGMQRRVRAAGLSAMIADTDEDPDAEREVLDQLSAVVDRLILASPRVSDGDLTDLAQRCAVVLINRELPGLASVVGNNADGIRQSVTHLLALGHRRIGYAGGPSTSWSDSRRRAGLAALALPDGQEIVDLGAFRASQAGGVAAADLAIAAGVSAVVAFNDQLALGVLGRLAERGVAVPEAMSVVGFDDVPVARLLAPPLTTVAVPTIEIGERAAGLLIDAAPQDSPLPQIVLEVELQVRRSSAPPPG
ncbi:LacI family DNA-binding transcriptional regulator [Ruania albidiflava]|uniref:LacI family DNA-binding transcriptional regulator n=1 Tax=Ruania albidiflava TaxID=366586 RepID=UPI0003B781B4|nr:LacI family DNA-binding transcriptional regulator [Ruania albidiflava]